MATHSIILAGEIPWTEEPGGLQSMEMQSLVGYSPWRYSPWATVHGDAESMDRGVGGLQSMEMQSRI